MQGFVYPFDQGNKAMKTLLGGKGANLCEMTKLGLPVPPGFIISTQGCQAYTDHKRRLPERLVNEVKEALRGLEVESSKVFGGLHNPLLVSVRSGASVSMPGMMDTVLNLGLNSQTVEVMACQWGRQFAYDLYRRFIQMFSEVVLGLEKYKFDKVYKAYDHGQADQVIGAYKALVLKESGKAFPEDVMDQLMMTIEAVFESWHNPRAKIYRQVHDISDGLGTAVTVQAMVFGNYNETSATGVVFTRNPSTGDHKLYGEYLMNAQGEDVVAGLRTPKPIEDLKVSMPEIYESLVKMTIVLENHYKDMQDIEFTIEDKKLYLLQTRQGKRTCQGALQIAVDLVKEGVLSEAQALMTIDPNQLQQLLHPRFSTEDLGKYPVLCKGLPASPGAACGQVYLTAEKVKLASLRGETCILVRPETSPEDIEGMVHAQGILTSRGGMTSHAAVVARGMGKCCIAGCSQISIDEDLGQFTIGCKHFNEGDFLALDGSTGHVYGHKLEATERGVTQAFEQIMAWSDVYKTLEVRANADLNEDAQVALNFGATGIGLCRTEHMFFQGERMNLMRAMILSDKVQERKAYIEALKPYQTKDFYDLFRGLKGLPLTIRLLDPPLHEFLPKTSEEIELLAQSLKIPLEDLYVKIKESKEENPMLGHRGARLAMTYPEIYDMQVESIFESACALEKEGYVCQPELMLPLIGFSKEFDILKARVEKVANRVIEDRAGQVTYKIGTMIEVPRAALTADKIGQSAAFFSFGTNDLTQMTLGFSRDDSTKFIQAYRDQKIFDKDPFATIDTQGVGQLMTLATRLGRQKNPDLKIGICGEHGGDPKSIEFCHRLGLDYVSCSPYRVPVARLAAAQCAIAYK